MGNVGMRLYGKLK